MILIICQLFLCPLKINLLFILLMPKIIFERPLQLGVDLYNNNSVSSPNLYRIRKGRLVLVYNSISLTELENNILNKINYYINENKRVNIETIAKDCFVSKGTIVKLAKKMGFSGYSEMYYVTLASRNKSLSADYYGMKGTFENNKAQDYVNALCDLLWRYRDSKIYLDSLGICDSARDYYLQKLLIFGFNAFNSYHFEAFHVQNPGLYLFFSYSGNNSTIIEKVKVAIDNGFNVIAFTANENSLLKNLANYTIVVSGNRSDKENYQPNLFTANLIILFELVLSEYSKKYLKIEQDDNSKKGLSHKE